MRMNPRRLATAIAALLGAMAASPLSAQQNDSLKAISSQLMTPAKGFVQPKTDWGEPDISGVWTSDAALGIPRERAAKYGNRAFLTDEEYAEVQKADADRRKRGENAVGAF